MKLLDKQIKSLSELYKTQGVTHKNFIEIESAYRMLSYLAGEENLSFSVSFEEFVLNYDNEMQNVDSYKQIYRRNLASYCETIQHAANSSN